MVKRIIEFFHDMSDIASGKSIKYEELGDFAGIWLKGILFISTITFFIHQMNNSTFPLHQMIGIVIFVWSLLILVFWFRAQSYHVVQQSYFRNKLRSENTGGFSSFKNVHAASRNLNHNRHKAAMNVKKFIQLHAYNDSRGGSGGGGITGGIIGGVLGSMMKQKN